MPPIRPAAVPVRRTKEPARLGRSMTQPATVGGAPRTDPPPTPPPRDVELPVVPSSTSQFAELSRPVQRIRPEVAPQWVERGVVVFDLDGTLLDDIGLISAVAADVLEKAFGTPAEEGRVHYLATTGMPFEAQLAQLYPDAPEALRASTARTFHQRKVTEAYAKADTFPEVPKLLKRLAQERWTLVVSTGAETEMADLLLEREGLRFWFEEVLGSGEVPSGSISRNTGAASPSARSSWSATHDSTWRRPSPFPESSRSAALPVSPAGRSPRRTSLSGGRPGPTTPCRSSPRLWRSSSRGLRRPTGHAPAEAPAGRAGTESLKGRGWTPPLFEPGSRDPQSPRIGQATPSRPRPADGALSRKGFRRLRHGGEEIRPVPGSVPQGGREGPPSSSASARRRSRPSAPPTQKKNAPKATASPAAM